MKLLYVCVCPVRESHFSGLQCRESDNMFHGFWRSAMFSILHRGGMFSKHTGSYSPNFVLGERLTHSVSALLLVVMGGTSHPQCLCTASCFCAVLLYGVLEAVHTSFTSCKPLSACHRRDYQVQTRSAIPRANLPFLVASFYCLRVLLTGNGFAP